MSWRAITEDDARSAWNSEEDQSLRMKYLSAGQGDPLPTVIAQVTGEVREAIRSAAGNKLSASADEVPEGVIYHAVAIIRHRLFTRYEITIGEARLMEFREANTTLREIAAGKRAVERPEAAPDAPAAVPSLMINPRPCRGLDG